MTGEYIIQRRVTPTDDESWYEVMLSPFKTLEECLEYIKKYSKTYPCEHQNYKITYKHVPA